MTKLFEIAAHNSLGKDTSKIIVKFYQVKSNPHGKVKLEVGMLPLSRISMMPPIPLLFFAMIGGLDFFTGIPRYRNVMLKILKEKNETHN